MQKPILFLFVFLLSLTTALVAQPVYERHNYEVNPYLARMAQKGLVVWDDNILPLSRTQILLALATLDSNRTRLTTIEAAELDFYLKEYKPGLRNRKLSAKGDDFSVNVYPVVTGQLLSAGESQVFKRSIGVQLYGTAAKRWGFQFSFQDITEAGKMVDTSKQGIEAAHETGYVRNALFNNRSINYTEIRTHISYAFKKGSVSFGQDYLMWGYGQGGRLVLSDKAPTYPYIRLDLQPLSWLRFNYTHAWLKSDILDSARSYTIPNSMYGGIREVMVPKFMVSHSIDIRLKKGLNVMIGESMLYTDRLHLGYFIPVMFFKAFDNYVGSNSITRGGNGQFFFQLSSRDQLRNTHLYTTFFIDEIKISKVLDREQARNQLGYTIGGSVTDLGLSYLTLGAEYTRVRPFVYRNFLPAQNYTSATHLLGDWIGANSDRLLIYARYTPIPRLKLNARYQLVRKGSEGTLQQQYFDQPQPSFLFGTKKTWNDIMVLGYYEAIPRLYINASVRFLNQQARLSAGLTYGL
ncbi:MAG: capsule assembly Wzi family protein [Sphingomonadales bacterium]|nr:capsule assembly Wzi family protein [Sphingomonadales bacterium]